MANDMNPNIQSIGYPNIDNMNTWLTQTTFNYSLWAANSKITMTTVPWNSNYKDVVKFNTESDKDEWFANRDSKSNKLQSIVRVPKEGTVLLPFNYDEVITFNYLIAEYPLPNGVTSKSGKVKTKYYYFITDITYKNANVVECYIQLDVWTTFINDVNIGQSYLNRGHAPMTMSDVSTYLSDPINNNNGLLAPDINYGQISNVKHEKYIPFHSNEQYVLFATSSNPTGNWSNNVTCNNYVVNDGMPTNTFVFAIRGDNYMTFMNNIQSNYPQFVQTIQGMFFLDSSFIKLDSTFNFGGVTCFNVSKANSNLYDISLSKAMFNYPSEYDWITKLYTSPYSEIEITDNDGKTATVKIEDISSDASVKSMSSVAFPFINVKAFITGIGGSGSNSYAINKLNSETISMYKDNWQDYTWNVDIPMYAVFQKNSTTYDYSTKYDRIQQQNDINTSYNNTNASIQTSYDNTAASAQTTYDNSHDSNENNKVIAEDAIQTERDVTYCDISYNKLINDMTMIHQGDQFELQAWNQQINAFAADAGKMSTTVGGAMAAAGTIVAGLALGPAGAAAGAAAGGAAAAGVSAAGLATTGVQALGVASSIGSYCSSKTVSMGMWENQKLLIKRQARAYVELQNYLYGSEGDYNILISTGDVEPLFGDLVGTYDKLDFSIPTQKKDGKMHEKTRDIKAKIWTHETLVKDNNYSVTNDINTRNKTTTDTNNNRTATTGRNNNTRTKTNSETAIQNRIKQAALANNNQLVNSSGNGALDNQGLRGLDIKVKTQSNDIIRKTGNTFLRYGYSYNDIIDITNLNIMKYFTYWQFGEVWITSDYVFESALDTLRDIFTSGVTVWRNPDKIGKISATANTIS